MDRRKETTNLSSEVHGPLERNEISIVEICFGINNDEMENLSC